ncbi:MAG TPA: hypothetical protein VFU07_09690 [Candidatus Lumbricidophila sp.]|nr:hypothetical protein [Candidatus Lumbricidophila sp.]
MGFWSTIFGGGNPTVSIASPWAPAPEFATVVANDLLGDLSASGLVTRDIALKVPGIKRAHGIHCSIVGGRTFRLMDNDAPVAEQPKWLVSSDSGVSPYVRWFGVGSDLFFHGWACIGLALDDSDALHIPFGMWEVDPNTGLVTADTRIPMKFRERLIVIPLGFGENGVLADGADTIRASRAIDRAWIERVENPAPATELHFTDAQYDGMSLKEKRKIVDQWNEQRKRAGGQTAVTQSFIEVKALGNTEPALFESGRNAVRLDIANHAAVPASIIEGAKNGGGSDIEYSNSLTTRHELYDYGTKRFVQAIEARLSLDDVCAPGLSIRADLTDLMATATPNTDPTSED